MRFCNNCKRLASGKDPFCGRCGSSYDVKLCPRLHVNPRAATLCSQCGSRELSTPQPKLPVFFRLIRALHLGALLLLSLMVYVAFYGYQLLTDPNNSLSLMCIGFVLGLLFYLWAKLPKPMRSAMRKLASGKRSDSGAKR
jgi:hypothetical protein